MPPLAARWPPVKPPMTNPPVSLATVSKCWSGADDLSTDDQTMPSPLDQIAGLPSSVSPVSTSRVVPSCDVEDARDQSLPDGSGESATRSHVARSSELHRANGPGSHCCPSPAGGWQCGGPSEP